MECKILFCNYKLHTFYIKSPPFPHHECLVELMFIWVLEVEGDVYFTTFNVHDAKHIQGRCNAKWAMLYSRWCCSWTCQPGMIPSLTSIYVKVPKENNSNRGGKFEHSQQNGPKLRLSEEMCICLPFTNNIYPGIHQA